MVIYRCERCKNIFYKKSNYDKHLERKYPCMKVDVIFECDYCDNRFETKGLLNKHMKDRCTKKKDMSNMEELEKLKIEMKKLKELFENQPKQNIINNTNNTTNINNTINTQFIVNFGKEDIDKLSRQDKIEILMSSYNCIYKCFTKVNLNPKIPEQMNIYIPDLKSSYGYKFVNNDFIIVKMNKLLLELLQNRANDVRDIMEQNNELGVASKYLDRCQDRLIHIDTENEKHIEELKEEVKIGLYNFRKCIIENKNKNK